MTSTHALTKVTTLNDDDVIQIALDPANAAVAETDRGIKAINLIGLARTPAEIANNITPVNLRKDAGDVLRYGLNTTPGTTDTSTAWRNALLANKQVFVSEPDIFLVTQDGGNNWCVRNTNSNRFIDACGSILKNTDGALQILRNTGTANVHVHNLLVEGPNSDGADGGGGLLQFNSCVTGSIFNCHSKNSDSNGITVSSCTNVDVIGCSSNNDSKTGLYINLSTDCRMIGCRVLDSGGHTVSGNIVGAGIQASGNTNLIIDSNIIEGGTGYGILCDDNSNIHPSNNVISNNTILNCSNPTNTNVSSGIRCVNGDTTKLTSTQVIENYIRGCGLHSIFMQNHHAFRVLNNTCIESVRDGIVIDTLTDGVVMGNDIWNSDTAAFGGRFSIHLVNACTGVTVKDNAFFDSAEYAAASATLRTNDASSGANTILLRLINSGTATLLNGQTTIDVTHGQTYAPNNADISVHAIENWGTMTEWWVDGINSTKFTISADVDPGEDVDFSWRLYGE